MTTQQSKPRPLRRREGPTDAELKDLYDAGTSVRNIARALGGWPYATVHYRLKLAGTQFRPRGAQPRVPTSEIFQERPGDTR